MGTKRGDFPGSQWLRLQLPLQEMWVQSLVGELRSHMPCNQKNQNTQKEKQYCDEFNKDFKHGPHQKYIYFLNVM